MNEHLARLQNVKSEDFIAIARFLAAMIPSCVMRARLKRRHAFFWLICEEAAEARDNGYVFFEYIKEHHPETEVYYAIKKDSPDYEKLKRYEPYILEAGSVKHWIYYLAADVNISSQKGGKPNAAVCYALEVSGLLKNRRVFLQHGVMLNNAEFLHYRNTKMRLFIAGAAPEYAYIRDTFGYPKGWVRYCGLCRFDRYHGLKADPKKILLMPTWRYWLKLKSRAGDDGGAGPDDAASSEYITAWKSLLRNERLLGYLRETGTVLYFYPHRNAQHYLHLFRAGYPVILCTQEEYDIQALLKECSLMITDYSSVSMDFAYMKKPVIYYQFDEKKYRKYQYGSSYFDYRTCGFGTVAETEEEAVELIVKRIENGFAFDEKAEAAHRAFFKLYDDKNCERVYAAICRMRKPRKR